jgi:excisionase family DNA binding protein
MSDTTWFRIKPDATGYSHFSESKLLRAIRAGQLRAVKVGNRYRLKREWIDDWILQQSPDYIADRQQWHVVNR